MSWRSLLTTTFPPIPWLLTVTPSHWLCLLSLFRLTEVKQRRIWKKIYIKIFRSAHPLTLELQRTESRNHSTFGAINLIIEYNRPQIPAADKFVISALQCTFSIYVHSLAVVLLWCDRTSEQSSRSAAPQQALPCCLRRPHKDPEGTEVTVRWLDWKARSYLLANSGCLIVQPTTISCVFKIFHVCSQHGGDHSAAVCIIS